MLETHKALVLSLAPVGESFLKLNLLSPEAGAIHCLKRISKKKPLPSGIPDLFDTAEIDLEHSGRNGTGPAFLRDYRPLRRRPAIGHNYRTLEAASEFCTLLVKNAPYMGDPAALHSLTEESLDAFARHSAPSIVLLKSLYLLLKAEGYPVRESWWPQVPAPWKTTAKHLLNRPVSDADKTDRTALPMCQAVTQNLYGWMRRETELILPVSPERMEVESGGTESTD